jgi:hypothetical protein
VLDRRRDRKDTHVVVPEEFALYCGATTGRPPSLPLRDDDDGVAHMPVDGPSSGSQAHSSCSAGGFVEPLGFTTC